MTEYQEAETTRMPVAVVPRGGAPMPSMTAGENLLQLVVERKRALQVADFIREEAVARIKAEGTYGMDEPNVFSDWVNDVLADPDPGAYGVAAAEPAKAYSAYVATRLEDPFHVSYRAVRALSKRTNEEEANAFVHLRWRQELAWAQRIRTMNSAKEAVLAHGFLMNAARNPSREFADLAHAWDAAKEDGTFLRSASHGLTAHEIRHGNTMPLHKPVFLGMINQKRGEKLERMGLEKLSGAANAVKAIEQAEVRGVFAQKAANAARRTPLCRIMGIIGVAIETAREPDVLAADERRFLLELERGKVRCPTAGLPYNEFVDWLRATPAGEPPPAPRPYDDACHVLAQHLLRPSAWLASLPADYIHAGAMDGPTYRSWIHPIATREVSTPRDLVCSYGFHLARKAYRH